MLLCAITATSWPSLSRCNSFSMLSIKSFCYILSVPYFTPKSFCFVYIWLLVRPRAFSTYLWLEFPFVLLEFPVLFVLLDFITVSFFANTFWFISSSCMVRLVCCFGLVFSSQHIPVFPFIARCHSFFTSRSSLILHPGFVFLFGFFTGILILSQTNFISA